MATQTTKRFKKSSSQSEDSTEIIVPSGEDNDKVEVLRFKQDENGKLKPIAYESRSMSLFREHLEKGETGVVAKAKGEDKKECYHSRVVKG